MRNLRHFNSENFLNDLNQQPWAEVCHNAADPNKMWQIWKSLLMETIDKHAPIRIKRVGKKNSPWVTGELIKRILFERDSLKKRTVKSYLTNRSQKCKVNGELSNSSPLTCGIPQGSSLGPLLFLIYINDLPNCLDMAQPRMFADDTSVSYASDSLDEIQNVINSELKNLNSWLIANRLSLNITKTEFMIIGSRQRMNATQNDIAIRIRDREINRADVVKSLGMHIDRHLSWSEHIHKISKKISSAIGALKRARPFISKLQFRCILL